jgi:hypothetical protein
MILTEPMDSVTKTVRQIAPIVSNEDHQMLSENSMARDELVREGS